MTPYDELKQRVLDCLTGEPVSGAELADALDVEHCAMYTVLVEMEASGQASLLPLGDCEHYGWVLGWNAERRERFQRERQARRAHTAAAVGTPA